jgi:negative regulator of sigma E activity
VPNLDDEQFESYLKQFRPLAAEPLETAMTRRVTRRSFALAALAAAAMVLLAVLVLTIHHRREQATLPQGTRTSTEVEQLRIPRPLTLGRANAWLAHAPSFRAALNGMAFESQGTQQSTGTQSALAVLRRIPGYD